MPLPKIETPKYTMNLPSNGEELIYRPFIVREQKLILQAVEMEDENQLNHALEDVLKACTFGKLDLENAPVYDVEYALLNIRAKSAGEKVDMTYRCNNLVKKEYADNKVECGAKIPISVVLSDVKADIPSTREYNIMLTENVGVQMRDLPYSIFKSANGKLAAEVGLNVVTSCISKVFDKDQTYNRKDFTEEELEVFVENLSNEQFARLESFVDTMPALRQKIKLVCPECGNEEMIVLEGIGDFLT